MKIKVPHDDGKKVSPARRVAYNVLLRVEGTQSYADILLDAYFKKEPLSPADRHLAWELVFGVLRHRNRLDWTLKALVREDWERQKPPLKNALRLGAYQLIFLDRVPAYAAINESVELAAKEDQGRFKGLVNAILRKVQREGEKKFPDKAADPLGYVEHYLSHPRWLAQRWVERYGAEETLALAEADNQQHPFTIAVNPLGASRDEAAQTLESQGAKVTPGRWSPLALEVQGLAAPFEQEIYKKGLYWAQDEASQLMAYILNPRPGEIILDACSGKGTKALQMALMMGNRGEVLALDPQERVKALIQEGCRRLDVTIIKPITGKAQETAQLIKSPVDKALMDAPCSGLGTLRRHPEIKWRRRPADFERLAKLQLEILTGAAAAVKPGGSLVYAVCTWEPEETKEVIDAFLKKHPEWQKVFAADFLPFAPAQAMVGADGYFRSFPHKHGADGFFGAKLVKEK